MRRFEVTIHIAASPERVWLVLSDIERWPEWTASMTHVQRLETGPIGVGHRARVKQPKLAEALFTITSWVPPRGFQWVTRSAAVGAVADHTIESQDGGSRVTLSVEFSGPLGGVVSWLYGSLTTRYILMEAEGLKARVEAVAAS